MWNEGARHTHAFISNIIDSYIYLCSHKFQADRQFKNAYASKGSDKILGLSIYVKSINKQKFFISFRFYFCLFQFRSNSNTQTHE